MPSATKLSKRKPKINLLGDNLKQAAKDTQRMVCMLEVFILNTQLTSIKVEFQADRPKQHLFGWKYLTSDLEILQTVSGLPIELTGELVQTHHYNCSQQHQLVIDDEIEMFLQKNVST